MEIETAVVLAAGRGKRMNPLTEVIPKPMLRIAGVPLLERIVRMLLGAGIQRIITVVGYRATQITSYFKGGEQWGVDIQYAAQKELLGMADALKTARKLLEGEQDFLVCAADTLVSVSHVTRLLREHRRRCAAITLCLQKIKLGRTLDTALVCLEKDGSISHIVEKPPLELVPSNIACLPLYILNHEVLDQVEQVKKSIRGEYELQDAIQGTIELGKRVQGFLIDSRVTISNLHDFLSVNFSFLNKLERPIRGTVARSARVIAPSLVCQGSTVECGGQLGPYGYLETGVKLAAGAQVKNSVILTGATVEKNARLYNTVVLPGTVVPAGTQLGQEGTNTIVCFSGPRTE